MKYAKNINPRWLALRIIDGDEKLIESIKDYITDEDLDNIEIILEENKLAYDKRSLRF